MYLENRKDARADNRPWIFLRFLLKLSMDDRRRGGPP